jgi:hypothetical protein
MKQFAFAIVRGQILLYTNASSLSSSLGNGNYRGAIENAATKNLQRAQGEGKARTACQVVETAYATRG